MINMMNYLQSWVGIWNTEYACYITGFVNTLVDCLWITENLQAAI